MFDFVADFLPRPGATDQWTPMARVIAKALAATEPRLRFRLRNLGAEAPQVQVLTPEQVPPEVAHRVEVPKGKEFWVHNYYCHACKTGVNEIRAKLHKKCEVEGKPALEQKEITHRGIRQTWVPRYRLIAGVPARTRAWTGTLYSVALCTARFEPEDFDGFDGAIVIPGKEFSDTPERVLAIRSHLTDRRACLAGREPVGVALSISRFFQDLGGPKVLDPLPGEETGDGEDAEYEEQLARARGARALLAARLPPSAPAPAVPPAESTEHSTGMPAAAKEGT